MKDLYTLGHETVWTMPIDGRLMGMRWGNYCTLEMGIEMCILRTHENMWAVWPNYKPAAEAMILPSARKAVKMARHHLRWLERTHCDCSWHRSRRNRD